MVLQFIVQILVYKLLKKTFNNYIVIKKIGIWLNLLFLSVYLFHIL